MRYLLIITLFLFTASCEKSREQPPSPSKTDNSYIQVGQYLPFSFGNKWFYKKYTLNNGVKTLYGREIYEYDSVPGIIYIYNSQRTLESWMYVSRKNDYEFTSGSGSLLLSNRYTDSPENNSYLLQQGTNYKNYIKGGLHNLQTRFGKVPCIVTCGNSGSYYWTRYFGRYYGIVKHEEYTLQGTDTIDHYSTEIDSFYNVK